MIRFCNDWLLLPQRLALHQPSATAVLADVHLGYSAARQHLGDAIPWRSVADEMHLLVEAARAHDLRALVVAGDLFERGYDSALHRQFLDLLDGLHIQLLGLVPGNHDRGIDKATLPIPTFPDGYDLASWHIVHGDRPTDSPRSIQGHWHPATRLKGRKAPCFLTLATHLMLPAFSLDAAGAEVRTDLRWRDWDCYVIDEGDVVHIKK